MQALEEAFYAMPAKSATVLLVLMLWAVSPVAALSAQESESRAPATPAPDLLEEVRVVAPRIATGVSPYIDADITMGADAIEAFAVSDLGELLDELAPDLDSGRGGDNDSRVILVNGQRIASFAEIRRFPTEAVSGVEIYPKEVALQFGFRADQKVVNFLLKPRFRAVTSRAAHSGFSDTGGGAGGEQTQANLGFLRVQDAARMNLDLTVNNQAPLHDSDREVPASTSPLENVLTSATMPTRTDVRPFRTLIAQQNNEVLSGSYANLFRDRISVTFSGNYQQEQLRTEQGLAGLSYRVPADHPRSPFQSDVDVERLLALPLTRDQETRRFEANATFAANWRGVAFSWLTSYVVADRDAITILGVDAEDFETDVSALNPDIDPFVPAGAFSPSKRFDNTRGSSLSSELFARGVLLDLPHGPLQTSARALWRSNSRKAETRLGTGSTGNRVERDIAEVRLNLDAPLLRDSRIGQLAVNANAETAQYSDFGQLSAIGTGITWNPSSRIRLTGSLSREEGAPTMEQLGDPVITVPNRRTFDFASGEAVDAVELSGGNQDLRAERRDVLNLSARVRLSRTPRLTLTVSYLDSIIDDPILRFANQSAELEAAFPARYERNQAGSLLLFDTRPINLQEERRREFRWALRYRHEFQPADPAGDREAGGTSAIKVRGPRMRLTLHHAITLEDTLTLAPGILPIDYVGVASAGRPRGGAEHFVTLRGTYVDRGFVARLNASWQDGTESLPNRADTLRFEPLFRADLDFAYNFKKDSQWVQRLPALEGSRVKLSLVNLLDSKPRVSDQSGATPLGLTEDELAPRGRHFALEFRKLFQ